MSANRDAMMRLRAQWKAQGRCTRCGGEKDQHKHCAACYRYRADYAKAKREADRRVGSMLITTLDVAMGRY